MVLSGDIQADLINLSEDIHDDVQIAFDMVGRTSGPNATLAALHSLHC